MIHRSIYEFDGEGSITKRLPTSYYQKLVRWDILSSDDGETVDVELFCPDDAFYTDPDAVDSSIGAATSTSGDLNPGYLVVKNLQVDVSNASDPSVFPLTVHAYFSNA